MSTYTLAQHAYQLKDDGTNVWGPVRQDNMSQLNDGRIKIEGLNFSIAIGSLRVFVIAIGSNPQGAFLYNDVAFVAGTPVVMPVINATALSYGMKGDTVFIDGSNLDAPAITAEINGNATPTPFQRSAARLGVLVPDGPAGTGKIKVINGSATAVDTGDFVRVVPDYAHMVFLDSHGNSLSEGQGASDKAKYNFLQQAYDKYLSKSIYNTPQVIGFPGEKLASLLQSQYYWSQRIYDRTTAMGIGLYHLLVNSLMDKLPLADLVAQATQYAQSNRDDNATNATWKWPLKQILMSATYTGKPSFQYTTVADLPAANAAIDAANADFALNYKKYGFNYFLNLNGNPDFLDPSDLDVFDPDKQHFNDNGYDLMAQEAAVVIEAARLGLELPPKPNFVLSERRWDSETAVSKTANNFNWGDALGSGDVLSTSSVSGILVIANALNGFPAVMLTNTALTGLLKTGIKSNTDVIFYMVVKLPNIADNQTITLMACGRNQVSPNTDVYYRGTMASLDVFGTKLIAHTNGSGYNPGSGNDPGENSGSGAPVVSYDQYAYYAIRLVGGVATSYSSVTGTSTPVKLFRNNMANTVFSLFSPHFDTNSGDFAAGLAYVVSAGYAPASDAKWAGLKAAMNAKYQLPMATN